MGDFEMSSFFLLVIQLVEGVAMGWLLPLVKLRGPAEVCQHGFCRVKLYFRATLSSRTTFHT